MSPILLVGVLVSAIAACGGDSGPSKESYIADADEICASASTEASPLLKQIAATDPMSLDSARSRRLATPVKNLQAVGSKLVADLRALDRPADDAEPIDRFLGATATLVDTIGRAADALETGDSTGALSALANLRPMSTQVKDAAGTYGFKRCGSVVNLP